MSKSNSKKLIELSKPFLSKRFGSEPVVPAPARKVALCAPGRKKAQLLKRQEIFFWFKLLRLALIELFTGKHPWEVK